MRIGHLLITIMIVSYQHNLETRMTIERYPYLTVVQFANTSILRNRKY